MKNIFLKLAVLPLLFACQAEKVKEVNQYTIEQFYKTERIGGDSFSPDEKSLLVTSDRTGIFNIYALPLTGGEPVALSHSQKESIWGVSYFPTDERILYQSDSGGNEIDHIFLRNTDGATVDLTPWPGAKSSFGGWARDEKSFFFVSNKRDQQYFDLYEMEIGGMTSRMVYENREGLDVSAMSKDKKYLVLIKSITTANNEMYLYELASKKMTHISQHEGDATYSPQFFDNAGEYLYFVSDEENEFSYLARYNMQSGAKEKVFGTDWDVWYAYDSWNEKYRVIGINADGKTEIRVIDLASGADVEFPAFEGGNIGSVTIPKSESFVKFTVGSSRQPSDIYTYHFSDKETKKLTGTLNPEINPGDLVEASVVRYKSFDGLEIPAIYYQPLQASGKNKVPALVWVHGGPGGQSRIGYQSIIQYLVNHGYAILAVNNRGSSGYGKTFFKMDDKAHGDTDLKDCVYGKEFLNATGIIDPEKIGIMGGSYGGYMTLAALTYEPEAFAVGVDLFGISNWLRTLRSIPPWWTSFKDALYTEMGDPGTADSIMLYNYSPLFHSKNIIKPLMVLQGANDPRVLKVESDEIVEAVKANGVPVEYVLFEDEGHGFVKKENEMRGYSQVLAFLDKYLKKVETPVQ
ncbi:MAG TPA: alpha/beta fold hydrolase [Cyclobacteriaceae bacterium]|nr:alpha/beta fold hydrolase [Cyclobacteriaceae bacterium]